jgi:hypothetical protein
MPQGLWPQGSGVRIPSLTLIKSKGYEETTCLPRRIFLQFSNGRPKDPVFQPLGSLLVHVGE